MTREVLHRYQGGCANGRGNYIHVMCDRFVHFTQYSPPSLFCIGGFVIYIYCEGVILPLNLNYICVFIDMFFHNITVSTLICLCMLYNIIIGCNSSWYLFSIFILCMGYSTTALLLHLHLN